MKPEILVKSHRHRLSYHNYYYLVNSACYNFGHNFTSGQLTIQHRKMKLLHFTDMVLMIGNFDAE